jgi:hypothetical protein
MPRPERAMARAGNDEWSRTNWEGRHDTMTWLVLPTMARKFQAFAGTEYPELSCFSCHGADAEQVAYAMPHGLPALDPDHLPSPHSSNAREARYATFMTDVVTPTLAALLEKPDVSCMTCHPQVGDE